MAQWIMMVFTAVAAVLLFMTFRATQKMAEQTSVIGELQSRPYMTYFDILPTVTSNFAYNPPKPLSVDLSIEFRNSGVSPAVNLLSGGAFCVAAMEDPIPELSDETTPPTPMTVGGGQKAGFLSFNVGVEEIERLLEGDAKLYVLAEATYGNVGNAEARYTTSVFFHVVFRSLYLDNGKWRLITASHPVGPQNYST